MPYRLEPFSDLGLDTALLEHLLAEHAASTRPRLDRFWRYYRNPEAGGRAGEGGRRPRLAQESGLPARLVGASPRWADDRLGRREVVVENDIGWRVQTMVDFMFGRPVLITSTARDPALRETIERVLASVWEDSGGVALMQDMALLGHVYGHVDLVLRAGSALPGGLDAAAGALRVEAVEPTRGIPLLDPGDYRRIDAYIIHAARRGRVDGALAERTGPLRRLIALARGAGAPAARGASAVTEIISADAHQVYEDERLVYESEQSLTPGEIPLVHIQNIAQPYFYEGVGEVEPLIPLQDELNTRLSDRASRVTLQSFKMYLVKGFDPDGPLFVGPGQIWKTDNPLADVKPFGGDSPTPGEEQHILEIREALDKTSGVPPIAAGVVRAKIGNLSSANALRITLMGTLSKTARKRVTYGGGIERMCRLILAALDHAGALRTDPADRGVRLVWSDPLPEDPREAVATARGKRELGVPRERVLEELGYSAAEAEG